MIHAAIAGSLERFMVLLIEQTVGAFPLWLAPEQMLWLAPINDANSILEYAAKLKDELKQAGLRANVDASSESVGKKIRAAGVAKVPYTVVIGEKEIASGEVSPRLRQGHGDFEGSLPFNDFITKLRSEVADRARTSAL